MWKKIIGSLLRHAATAIGGGVAVSTDGTEQIVGAAVAVIGAVASLIKAAKDAKKERE